MLALLLSRPSCAAPPTPLTMPCVAKKISRAERVTAEDQRETGATHPVGSASGFPDGAGSPRYAQAPIVLQPARTRQKSRRAILGLSTKILHGDRAQ